MRWSAAPSFGLHPANCYNGEKTFAGIDRMLLISTQGDNDTRIRQHTAAVAVAQRARVGFIAYTSLTNAEESELILAAVYRVTEEAIRETGIPY